MNKKAAPKLARRRDHKNSSFRAGRTIGEKRERLETKRERAAARKKDKLRKVWRIISTTVGFLCLAGVLILLFLIFSKSSDEINIDNTVVSYEPTIEIIDEDAKAGGQITSRMREYIGQVEADLRSLGYKPNKAVVPSGAIRQINFYLDGYKGYIKMLVDRGAGVSVEDTDRMIRYLTSKNIKDFEYIDVRLEGKAYWK